MSRKRVTFSLSTKGSVRGAYAWIEDTPVQIVPNGESHIFLEARPERYLMHALVAGNRQSSFELKLTLAGGVALRPPYKGTITSTDGYPIVDDFVIEG